MTPGCRLASRSFLLGAAEQRKGATVRLTLLIVFGAAGTLARYGLQGLVQYRTGPGFPSGTLAVNLLGCFLLGGVTHYGLQHIAVPPDWRIGISVGFFGAFTTFSAFSWETARMLQDGEWKHATLYVLLSVAGGLFAVLSGMRLADKI
jgi:fluoride exporter